MKYKVRIKSSNKMFVINGKPVRSPFETFLSDKEVSLIKSRIKFYGMLPNEYDIQLIQDSTNDYSKIESTPIIEEPTPILKPKIIEDKKILHRPVFKKSKIDSKIPNEPEIQPEQIIKKYDENVEVKIEELSTKSLSILESFLKTEI